MAGDSVDWQLSRKRVNERSSHLLKSEQWSDCAFTVGTEPNQKVFNAHKLFLAMSSPVFEAMFYGGMAEKNEPIPILDVQPDAFKALLEYIYTDEINITTFDQACELCYAAKKYMLPHLVEKCTERLWQDLFGSNACKAYEFAKLFEEGVLMERSLQIIRNETEAVLADPSFEDVELATLLLILDNETLNISSERDLFNGVYRWAKKECARKGLSDDSESDLRSVVGPALEKIHFLTLTPLQFAEGPALAPLLTRDESFAILMNISNPSSCFPMPEGFSKVVEPRKRFRLASDQQPVNALPPAAINREGGKFICQRGVELPLTPTLNNSIMDCNLSFVVDRNICVIGIQIPSQVRVDDGPSSRVNAGENPSYTELLYAHLLDSDNSRLTYTHYTTRVWYGQQVEINFNRPVYIQRSKTYKIVVVLNKQGWYPTSTGAASAASCNGVQFTFWQNPAVPSQDRGLDSLIRSIIYTF